MAPALSLTVPYEPQKSRKAVPLATQVQQIIAQKGAFRHLSEESIRAETDEVTKDSDPDRKDSEANDESEVAETTEVRMEKLWKARNEMLQRLDYAQMEILSALDFVSLLLSTHSEAAKASMSPALKDAAPTGSMDMRKVREKELSAPARKRLDAVSQSWKANKFESASKTLDESSLRLQKEAALQSKYWEQIAALKAEGWPVSRLPDDSRAIVVHYGFPEAAAQYRGRGFALVRQDVEGDLEISTPTSSFDSKRVRATIIRHDQITGVSTERLMTSRQLDKIQKQLVDARDALFDDELFYEVGREARLIANQGVALRSDSVDVEISPDLSLRINYGEQESWDGVSRDAFDNALADFVIVTLRMLLVGEHEASYQRRSSQKPPPLSQATRPTPEYALLRPLITQLRHHALTLEASKIIGTYEKILSMAGLKFSPNYLQATKMKQSEVDLNELKRSAKTAIGIHLPSGKTTQFHFETYLAAPIYGSEISADQIEYAQTTLKTEPTHSLNEFEEFVQHIIATDISSMVLETTVEGGQWSNPRPQLAELVLLKSTEKVAKVRIQCLKTALNLSVLRKGQSSEETLEWTGDSAWYTKRAGEREESKKDFKEVISELSSTT